MQSRWRIALLGAVMATTVLGGLWLTAPPGDEPEYGIKEFTPDYGADSVLTRVLELPRDARPRVERCILSVTPHEPPFSYFVLTACRFSGDAQEMSAWLRDVADGTEQQPVDLIPDERGYPPVGTPFQVHAAFSRLPLAESDLNVAVVFSNAEFTEAVAYQRTLMMQ